MTATLVFELIAAVMLVAGALFVLSGGVGLLRFPDFYTRTHAAALTDAAGSVLILTALLLLTPDWQTGVRLVLILLFMLLTGVTAAQALGQAARKDSVKPWFPGRKRR